MPRDIFLIRNLDGRIARRLNDTVIRGLSKVVTGKAIVAAGLICRNGGGPDEV
jgi:hypothetical protein